MGFKNNGLLILQQQRFNATLNQIRSKIKSAFAFMKGRFRRLKLVENIRLDVIVSIIMASCVLQSICISAVDNPNDIIGLNIKMAQEQNINPNNLEDFDETFENIGILISW